MEVDVERDVIKLVCAKLIVELDVERETIELDKVETPVEVVVERDVTAVAVDVERVVILLVNELVCESPVET